MHPSLERLLAALDLRRIGDGVYMAGSANEMSDRLFGGQVLAQALAAAHREVDDAVAHSLHACFLRRGTALEPIRLEAITLRRSRAFRTVQVVASQDGHAILHMIVSYHLAEQGPEHQIPMDEVGPPEGEAYEGAILRAMSVPGSHADAPFMLPVEIRAVGGLALFSREVKPPNARCWMRMRGELPDDPALHQCLFAYASDYAIMAPAVHPHPLSALELQSASLDHALWFHRDFRMDEWLLFELDSPTAAHARGIGRGLLYRRDDGQLVASCVQEGLMRPLTASSGEGPATEEAVSLKS